MEDEFTDQSGQDTIAKEYVEEQNDDVLMTEESSYSIKKNQNQIQKGHIFTFKKQSHHLLNVPKDKHTLSDLKERCDFPDQLTSENID